MPRQNLQKKSDDRIVKDSKKLNIIIRRKYVLSLSRENEFSSSMTSWNLNLWSYSTDCWKNFWSMKFKLTSVWLSFYQNELPIKKSFYQKNKKKKNKKKQNCTIIDIPGFRKKWRCTWNKVLAIKLWNLVERCINIRLVFSH